MMVDGKINTDVDKNESDNNNNYKTNYSDGDRTGNKNDTGDIYNRNDDNDNNDDKKQPKT